MLTTTTSSTETGESHATAKDAFAPAKHSFRVLVVDDSAIDRELIIRYLHHAWPFEHDLIVDTAADGHEAIQKLLNRRWTLVLLDWNMPGAAGGEVLRDLRQAGVNVPVVVVSGCEYNEIAETLQQHRVGYLHKDRIDASTLYRSVSAALLALALSWPAMTQRSCPGTTDSR